MQFSTEWLSDYVGLPKDIDDLAARLTAAGLAVESIETRGTDQVLDIEVTTNRPDCMNHIGVAREIAVLTGKDLRAPLAELDESEPPAADLVQVEVEDRQGCPRYVARVVRGVKVGPSPNWLVKRLESIGQRAINNVVDVTNFVLWEYGQPIHAFDLHKVSGSRIVVRRASADETLVTLDGEERRLNDSMLVIADAERPMALAGVMGGLESEVDESSVDLLIESAHFDPRIVRTAAAAFDLHTDASHRFERGADIECCRRAADRVAALLVQIAGGQVLSGAVDVRSMEYDTQLSGQLSLSRLIAFSGVEVPASNVGDWLSGLGFEVNETGNGEECVWDVEVPSWRYYDMRPDPTQPPGAPSGPVFPADLYEEVLRIQGFESLPASLPALGGPDLGSSDGHYRRERVRHYLTGCGYTEAITFAFHGEESSFPGVVVDGEAIRLANPLSGRYSEMRQSMLTGLLESALFNINRGAESVRLYEVGHVFPGDAAPELETLGLVAGGGGSLPWDRTSQFDLFDLKGCLEGLARAAGAEMTVCPEEIAGFLRGTAAEIRFPEGDTRVGYFGQLQCDDLPFPLFAGELDLVAFVEAGTPAPVQAPSRYPGIRLDLTLTHPLELSWGELATMIAQERSPELVEFGLKDRYVGSGVPDGAVNTTIHFLYNSAERSLTQDEVNAQFDQLSAVLRGRFGLPGVDGGVGKAPERVL